MVKGTHTAITVSNAIYRGLCLEAVKQHRSIANLTEYLLKKEGISELSDEELEICIKNIKKEEVVVK